MTAPSPSTAVISLKKNLFSLPMLGGVVGIFAVLMALILLCGYLNKAEHRSSLQAFTLGPHLKVIRDPSQNLTINDITTVKPDTQLTFSDQNWLQLSLSPDAIWLNFTLRSKNLSPKELEPIYMEIGLPVINNIDLYVLDTTGKLIKHAKGGDEVFDKDLPFSSPTFKLLLDPNTRYDVYLRLQSDSFMATSLSILGADELLERTLWTRFYTSVYYGMMLAMLLYNFFTYFFFRDKSYLFYVGHIIFLCLFQATLDGFLIEKFSIPGLLTIRWPAIYAGIANLSAIGFTRYLLDIKRDTSTDNLLLNIGAGFATFAIIIEPLLHNMYTSYFMMLTVIVSCFLVPVVGFKRYMDGETIASFFLLAWILYPCLLVIYCLAMAGLIKPNEIAVNATRIGCMLECALFSIALGYRMEMLRREKREFVRHINRQLQRDIKEISRGIEALASGNNDYKLSYQHRRPLASIANDFDVLAQSLRCNEVERKQWLSDISHELKTPITVFRATIESFQDGVLPINERTLSTLHKEALHLENLVKDLNELNLCEQRELLEGHETINIVELLEHELAFFQPLFFERSIDCQFKLDSPHILVDGNTKRLSQLFINLLNNTLKYTDSPGSLDISITHDDNAVNICWADSAPGVGEQHLPLLFNRLYRVEKSRSRSLGGSGLGLAICKAITEAHGGSISAQRSNTNGLAINIVLPSRRQLSNKNK